jgi:hypothetical protein
MSIYIVKSKLEINAAHRKLIASDKRITSLVSIFYGDLHKLRQGLVKVELGQGTEVLFSA